MTDFRALCAELVEALDTLYKQSSASPRLQTVDFDNGQRVAIPIGRDILVQDVSTGKLIAYARAALAEPVAEPPAVAERPSDEELRDLWIWAAGQDRGPWPTQYHCFARAVLARWGQPPAPPAEGEVAELVAQLHELAEVQDDDEWEGTP